MSEEMFHKEIPFKSDDKEFNNFFGFKLGMTMGEALFKAACYGLNINSIFDNFFFFENSQKISITLTRKGVTFCSCEIQKLILTFAIQKKHFYLICSEIIVCNSKIQFDIGDLTNLIFKYDLISKKRGFFHKPTKIFYICSPLNPVHIIIAKKHAKRTELCRKEDVITFLTKESREFDLGFLLDKALKANFSNISNEDKNALNYLVIGLMRFGLTSYEVRSIEDVENYAHFWGGFTNFWKKSDHSKKLLELAHKIKRIFEESDPEKIEETEGLISKAITEMRTSIEDTEEKEKKAIEDEAKKAEEEEKKRREDEINTLNESLDDL